MTTSKFFGHIIYQKVIGSLGEILLVNKSYFPILSDFGLNSFDAVWTFSGGETVKKIKDREVLCFNLFSDSGDSGFPGRNANYFYLKKHRQRLSLLQRFMVFLGADALVAAGTKEFHNYCEFRKKGLRTAIPVAAGIRFVSFFQAESFLVTKDFSPCVDLEEIVLNHPELLEGEKNQKKRRNILRKIANFAKKMHCKNLNQKDFNATHILLKNIEVDEPLVAIFDLERVDRNVFNRLYWPIKSLAELCFTLPDTLFSTSDKMYLFKSYKGKAQLNLLDRLQWWFVQKKADKIARHSKKRGLAPKAKNTTS